LNVPPSVLQQWLKDAPRKCTCNNEWKSFVAGTLILVLEEWVSPVFDSNWNNPEGEKKGLLVRGKEEETGKWCLSG